MKDFFARMQMKMATVMQGRRGTDELSTLFVVVGIVLLFVSFIPGLDLLSWVSLAALGYALFRCYSKNVMARTKENDAFLRSTEKPRYALKQANRSWTNRKTTLYFKCKGCGTTLSVPRGKGTLRVVCPKCKTETMKKS